MNSIEKAIFDVVASGDFINGKAVDLFTQSLSEYMECHVIPCGNGTDAIQIALMALECEIGDEVIIPAFNYAASSEVCHLLGLKPVYCDVDYDFNIDVIKLEQHITTNTLAIIPTHLFGKPCNMKPILDIADKYGVYVIEDNAQSLGSEYMGRKCGSLGHIGITSFFPTKNLGGYGDGGAIFTKDYNLSKIIRCIANHGQMGKYNHMKVGVNSRLDSIQAAVLNEKLKHLDEYIQKRKSIGELYNSLFWQDSNEIHTYNNYTITIEDRDDKFDRLVELGCRVYYPKPLYRQPAYHKNVYLENTERLCKSCITIPMIDDNGETAKKIIEII